MRTEDLKNGFPKMPEDMRAMVERQVRMQLQIDQNIEESGFQQTESAQRNSPRRTARKTRRSPQKITLIGLAAAMVLGTTVFAGFAGSILYKMHSEQVGTYGAKTTVSLESETDTAPAAGTESGNPAVCTDDVPDVKLSLSYLPEGMEKAEGETKFHYNTDTGLQGGISIAAYSMDMGDDAFEVLDTDVISQEDLQISGHDGVYLEKQRSASGDTIATIYIFYPEVHHVLQMWIGPDVSKDEAMKVAEGIELIPLAEGEKADVGLNWAWSSFVETQQETEIYQTMDPVAEMEHTHAVGESFSIPAWAEYEDGTSVPTYAENENGEIILDENGWPIYPDLLSAKVVSVEISDDLSLLSETDLIDSAWLLAEGEDGKLTDNEIQYIKSGNGVDTVDEIIKTEQVPQKLVYVTVDFTNTGDAALKNINFNGSLLPIIHTENGYTVYDRAKQDTGGQWDKTENTGAAFFGEMTYFDCQGTGTGNGTNYIDTLAPGETATVHMAWIVNEDELQYMYLSFRDVLEMSEDGLAIGYVDIRQ